MFGIATEMPPVTTATPVVTKVSGSDEQLQLTRAPSAGELLSRWW
jgi:hypothetical protein